MLMKVFRRGGPLAAGQLDKLDLTGRDELEADAVPGSIQAA